MNETLFANGILIGSGRFTDNYFRIINSEEVYGVSKAYILYSVYSNKYEVNTKIVLKYIKGNRNVSSAFHEIFESKSIVMLTGDKLHSIIILNSNNRNEIYFSVVKKNSSTVKSERKMEMKNRK